MVILAGPRSGGLRTEVSSTGAFQFWNVPPGSYHLKVVNLYGAVLHEEIVDIQSFSNQLRVRLPKFEKERPPSGAVSVASLRHKVPAKARKEFDRANEASRKGDSQSAIEHLKKATEIDPEYIEALNNLGVLYLRSNQDEQALPVFQKSVELDPHAPLPQLNLAATLMVMKRPAEAERAARRAVELNAGEPRAHYFLAMALLEQGKDLPAAINNLQDAAKTMPRAKLVLARILTQQGDRAAAREQLKGYLDSGHPENREQVQSWLAKLE